MKWMSSLCLMGGLLLLLSGCLKDEEPQADIDRKVIVDYLASKNITAEEGSYGMFYTIDTLGGSQHPKVTDTVEVRYRGYLTNGNVFDKTDTGKTFRWRLDQLIYGWQLGVPLLGRGGKGTFYLPSSLGYGPYPPPNSGIPANAVLIFDIELVDF